MLILSSSKRFTYQIERFALIQHRKCIILLFIYYYYYTYTEPDVYYYVLSANA